MQAGPSTVGTVHGTGCWSGESSTCSAHSRPTLCTSSGCPIWIKLCQDQQTGLAGKIAHGVYALCQLPVLGAVFAVPGPAGMQCAPCIGPLLELVLPAVRRLDLVPWVQPTAQGAGMKHSLHVASCWIALALAYIKGLGPDPDWPWSQHSGLMCAACGIGAWHMEHAVCNAPPDWFWLWLCHNWKCPQTSPEILIWMNLIALHYILFQILPEPYCLFLGLLLFPHMPLYPAVICF